jgi:hypothetical protein
MAASTVFRVDGISATVQMPTRSPPPPLPLDQPKYLLSTLLRSARGDPRLGRLRSKMLRPLAVGDELRGKTAKRGLGRFVQQQRLESLGGRFVRMIDRSGDLRLAGGVGLLVVDSEHFLAKAAKERTVTRHLVVGPGIEDGDAKCFERGIVLRIEFGEPPRRSGVSRRLGLAFRHKYPARE